MREGLCGKSQFLVLRSLGEPKTTLKIVCFLRESLKSHLEVLLFNFLLYLFSFGSSEVKILTVMLCCSQCRLQ